MDPDPYQGDKLDPDPHQSAMNPDPLYNNKTIATVAPESKSKSHCFQLEGDVQNFPSGIKHCTLTLENLATTRKGLDYEIRFAYILTDNWSRYRHYPHI